MKILQLLHKLCPSIIRDTELATGKTKDRGIPVGSVEKMEVATRPARQRTLPMMLATEFDALVATQIEELSSISVRDRIMKMPNFDGFMRPRADEDFCSDVDRHIACSMAKALLGRGPPLVLKADVKLKSAHRAVLYSEVALYYDYEDQEARRLWGIASVVEILVADGERATTA